MQFSRYSAAHDDQGPKENVAFTCQGMATWFAPTSAQGTLMAPLKAGWSAVSNLGLATANSCWQLTQGQVSLTP